MRLYREIFCIAAMVLAPLDSASAAASDQWTYSAVIQAAVSPDHPSPEYAATPSIELAAVNESNAVTRERVTFTKGGQDVGRPVWITFVRSRRGFIERDTGGLDVTVEAYDREVTGVARLRDDPSRRVEFVLRMRGDTVEAAELRAMQRGSLAGFMRLTARGAAPRSLFPQRGFCR